MVIFGDSYASLRLFRVGELGPSVTCDTSRFAFGVPRYKVDGRFEGARVCVSASHIFLIRTPLYFISQGSVTRVFHYTLFFGLMRMAPFPVPPGFPASLLGSLPPCRRCYLSRYRWRSSCSTPGYWSLVLCMAALRS